MRTYSSLQHVINEHFTVRFRIKYAPKNDHIREKEMGSSTLILKTSDEVKGYNFGKEKNCMMLSAGVISVEQ